MNRSLEVVGKFIGERFHFSNATGRVIIGELRLDQQSQEVATKAGAEWTHGLTIKGEADANELEFGRTYRFFGTWASYFNRRLQQREKQFHFRSFVPHIPHDREGVADYLALAGKGNGVGPSKARQLVDELGTEKVLQICREQPEQIAELVNIRSDQAQRIAEKLEEQQAVENATLEVNKLLQNRGFPKTLGRRVIKKWGNQAAEIISNDPYALMQFRGIGFRLTDKLYISLGKDAKSIDRQALCLWYGMASDGSGHTWFPGAEAVKRLRSTIGAGVDHRAAIERGREYGQINESHYGAIASIRTDGPNGPIDCDGDTFWLAEGRYAAAEDRVATAIANALEESTSQELTRYKSVEHKQEIILDHATCARCRRQLTARTVHVLDGVPYGPACIEYVDPTGQHETFDLEEWLKQNPEVSRWIEQLPSGVIRLPQINLWPDPSDLEILMDGENVITEHQRREACQAMVGRIGLLGGSPGTGKTTLVAAIIRALHRSGRVGLHEIALGAPTGKAAVRLSESLDAQGIGIKARTWHSLLGVGDADAESGQWSFRHNVNNPWPYKIIIGDESSMLDIALMASIFGARAPHAHMLFVGDVNQLPPVGNGAPFRDMITAALPYGELREIKRNSGGIVESCAKIRDMTPWTSDCDGAVPELQANTNLMFSDSSSVDDQINDLLELIDHESEFYGVDPVWDCQVLCAVNKSSKLSREKLNKLLQEKLSPSPEVKGTPFRLGDKVVCLKNGFYRTMLEIDEDDEDYESNERGEVYVANGELGVIEDIQDKTFSVELENPARLIQVPRGKTETDDEGGSTGCAWDLGYALTGHKLQGSEQRVVFIILDTYSGARLVCDRSWLYTGISRAKERGYLIGARQIAERMCHVQKINQRKTMLAKRIVLEQLDTELAGL